MKIIKQTFNAGMQVDAEPNTVQTTLYELIASINEDVSPEEDWIVTGAVLELLETGQAKFVAVN